MATKKYIALVVKVKDIMWGSEVMIEPVTITAEHILKASDEREKPYPAYPLITGDTKKEVEKELEKQGAADNLFLSGLRKLPEDAEIIIISKE